MRQIIAVLLLTGSAWAADLAVPGQYATISAAISKAVKGDRIIVAAGLYPENITINKNLQLLGAKADDAVISPPLGDGITLSAAVDTTTVISGFTIMARNGIGIKMATGASAKIRNCTISMCGGVGLSMNKSASIIRHNLFTVNHGAMSLVDDQASVITNNTLQNNTSDLSTKAVVAFTSKGVASATQFSNNLLKGNDLNADTGVCLAVCVGASPTVANNVMVENSGTTVESMWSGNQHQCIYVGSSSDGTTRPLITNNVLSFNDIGGGIAVGSGDPVITFNDVFSSGTSYVGTKDALGGISADPLFVDPEREDYTLQEGSPCIDTGTPGLNDPDGTRNDMGIYGGPYARFWGPTVYSGPTITSITVDPTQVQQGGKITVRASGTTVAE